MADGTAHYAEKVGDTQQEPRSLCIYIHIFCVIVSKEIFTHDYISSIPNTNNLQTNDCNWIEIITWNHIIISII